MNVDGNTTIGEPDEEQMPGCMVVVHQARSSRDTLEWMLWGQHELMIELLRGRDSWALARLCVDHMQFSKSDYLARIASEAGRQSPTPDAGIVTERQWPGRVERQSKLGPASDAAGAVSRSTSRPREALTEQA